MRCSTCSGELEGEVIRDLHVDVCRGCRGIWFDRGELESWRRRHPELDPRIPQGAEATIATTREARTGPCPRCATPTLEVATLDRVTFARCRSCLGVFLDRSAQKATHARDSGATTAPLLERALDRMFGDVLATASREPERAPTTADQTLTAIAIVVMILLRLFLR